jgi:hypothetical protein
MDTRGAGQQHERARTRERRWSAVLSAVALLAVLLIASFAQVPALHAQVIEPNGLQVPLSPPGSSEQSLAAYFAARMPPEPIDALRDASEEPGTFSPLCGFEAELVLSESSAPAGLAWYEVPDDPRMTPAVIRPLVAETTQPGATLSSTAIRSDPGYRGGLVGFALTKGGVPIYYSEASRNVECTKCAMPGHWKMMLAYASRLQPNVYYLAWEDWEGAHDSGWPDDGDFNDKVFRLTGVRCAGGGEACETGFSGQCAQGVTACTRAGESGSACNPLRPAQPERCDAIDNDCNGTVDDGNPCRPGEICKRGACVQACGVGEFVCPTAHVCDHGDCIRSACVGVQCAPGQVCRDGACGSPCDGVSCPAGQSCSAGACVDPCAGAECGAGRMCLGGACLDRCDCGGCPAGLQCDANNGMCVEPGRISKPSTPAPLAGNAGAAAAGAGGASLLGMAGLGVAGGAAAEVPDGGDAAAASGCGCRLAGTTVRAQGRGQPNAWLLGFGLLLVCLCRRLGRRVRPS